MFCVIAIYILIDPRSRAARYVGKANDTNYRLQQHCIEKYRSKKTNWVKRLKSLGMTPVMEVIEMVPEDSWEDAERFWIAFFKSCGAELLNMTNGGDGVTQTPEIRRSISESHTGMKHKPESLDKMRAWKRRSMTPEELERHTAINKARVPHPNSIATLHKHRDKAATPERIRKHSIAMTGFKWSEEALRNRTEGVRKALKGKPRHEDVKTKISDAWVARAAAGIKRKPPSPEDEARRIAAIKATYARKRAALMACEI